MLLPMTATPIFSGGSHSDRGLPNIPAYVLRRLGLVSLLGATPLPHWAKLPHTFGDDKVFAITVCASELIDEKWLFGDLSLVVCGQRFCGEG